MTERIAFLGEFGTYSHQACRNARPEMEPVSCRNFEEVIEAVTSGACALGVLPVENSTYGRVADIHHLLPESGLHIVGEAFVRVHIALLGRPEQKLEDITSASSHPMLLGQCREFLNKHKILPVKGNDTAGCALAVSKGSDPSAAALAAPLAGELYGLKELASAVEDQKNNTTRFLIMSREADASRRGENGMLTSFVFRVRNIPAALYKALGGFATNGVNMTKLESYMVDGEFTATQFYADVEGHPDDANLALALEELRYFTSRLTMLGTYPADRRRYDL